MTRTGRLLPRLLHFPFALVAQMMAALKDE
jgi:hypothetical protein